MGKNNGKKIIGKEMGKNHGKKSWKINHGEEKAWENNGNT